jgi:ribosome modulation factor
MEHPKSDHQREAGRAFEEGVTAGRDRNAQAAECPYLHDHLALRAQWMDGFAKGRTLAKQDISSNHNR